MRNSRWTVTMTGLALAATLVACGDDSSGKTAADPTPTKETPTSPSTDATTTSLGYTLLRNAGRGLLDAGSYGLVPAGSPVKNVAVIRAPAGYKGFEGWTLVTEDGDDWHALQIMTVDRIFPDPCGSKAHTKYDAMKNPGPTVKDLARALTEQKGATTSTPIPVTLDGYHGLYLDYRIAKGIDLDKCENDAFTLLTHSDDGWWLDVNGERLGIWILNVDGDRLMLSWVAVPGATTDQ